VICIVLGGLGEIRFPALVDIISNFFCKGIVIGFLDAALIKYLNFN
jgi:hypothetical protein